MIISGPNVQTLFRVAQARSTDATRPSLSGLKIEPFSDGVNVVATDGFILAVSHLSTGGRDTISDPVECIVPDAVLKLMKLAHFAKNYQAIALELTVTETENVWSYFAQGSKTTVNSPLDIGRYPQWRKAMPSADTFSKLARVPSSGYSLELMTKANAILGDKRYPFNLNSALMAEGCPTAVAQNDGILVFAMPATFSDDSAEGILLAILENARHAGLVPFEAPE